MASNYEIISDISKDRLARQVDGMIASGDWTPAGGVAVVVEPKHQGQLGEGPHYVYFQAIVKTGIKPFEP